MTDKERWAILSRHKKEIFKMCPMLDVSGIYCFYRTNEDNEKCAYIGQGVKLLTRVAQHFMGRKQHIDLSLYKHKLYSEKNLYGWQVMVLEYCNVCDLDRKETQYINEYKEKGYRLYNVTGGGQIDKQADIGERNHTKLKSYKNGKNLGYEKARQEIKNLFDKYLNFDVKKENKTCEKAKEKFEMFLKGE